MKIDYIDISKFLSFVLRHKPESIGLKLDTNGWAIIDELISKTKISKPDILLTNSIITKVVATNDKNRFIISDDGLKIRANQGHSINVDLQLSPKTPPKLLYHGTAACFLDSIMKGGIKPKQRQYVHLSKDVTTAKKVGMRHGKSVVIEIPALKMHKQGTKFFFAENGVWLTLKVNKKYLTIKP